MDSLRSIHARVAALARYRRPDDPEVVVARAELARCLEETRVLRVKLGSLPPQACAGLLSVSETGRASRV